MRFLSLIAALIFLTSFSLAVSADANQSKIQLELSSLDLEKIMADPDWMGNSPETPQWSLDGGSIFYQQKAVGRSHRDTFRLSLTDKKSKKLDKNELLASASASAKLNSTKTHGVFGYQGDIYLIELANNLISPLTSDAASQSNPSFADDSTISYLVGYQVFKYDLKNKIAKQIAEFKLEADPDKKQEKSYLEQSQPRLLQYIKQTQDEKEFQKERTKALKQHSVKTWYLGKGIKIETFRLSPDAKWLLLGTVESSLSGKADHMPEFVTVDGYVNDREVRPLVGTSKPYNETFYLVDLINHEKHSIDLSSLPGINDDPLKKLRKKAAAKIGYKYKDSQGPRAVYVHDWSANSGVEWTEDSSQLAMVLYSYDNKTRWIITLDTDKQKIKTAHWLNDDAWVNDWTFYQFGWMPDNQTLYYLSEEDGYSHLYIKKGKRRASQVTKGEFEVSNLTVSQDGNKIFYKANKKHPGIYEIYSFDLSQKNSHALTNLGGMNDYVLSPDESQLIVSHSSLTKKPELYLQPLKENSKAIKLTDTMSKDFTQVAWQAPKIVAVKSSHVDKPIYSRLYTPAVDLTKDKSKKRPAVMFVHGAGYLQNAHQGWSGYFREFMFHNYLTAKGYVVLDMDYRASKGYGRDWRTAIYRNMGTPELHDMQDGVQWLIDNMNVDEKRIGVYGGSYGGFMTFMALFKEPELFASGAALRPVTDWVHYNHGYTSNILNTPQVDPEAYERSSPIEFAEGLNKPLLIAHGMVDDNVFFKDSVRLVQKLIELKKTEYFETAIYPVEPHGFKQPSSWLDEYKRIDMLFDRTLQ